MSHAAAGASGPFDPRTATEAPLFADGLGDRAVSADATTGELVQILRINPALTAVPSFEFALRERVARLANFRHGYYARIRRVDRTQPHAASLMLVSDHVEGTRLSEILRVAEERGLQLDINAALCLVRQLLQALVLLHENARDAAHGLVAPERLVITPHGRLVVAEHVCGAAVEQMQFGRERLWHELRVAMPPSAGIPRVDQRADVTGIGVVALSVILGRPLRTDEFPRHLGDLLASARERTALGDEQPLSAPLRLWLARALQVDLLRAFTSAPEALAALDEISTENPRYIAAPVALETFLARYMAAVLTPPLAPLVAIAPEPPAMADVQAKGPLDDVQDLATLLGLPESGDINEALFNAEAPFSVVPEAAVDAPTAAPEARRRTGKWFALAASLVVMAGAGIAGYKVLAGEAAPALATLAVQSNPAGVPIFVDGVGRGVTPARLTLTPGPHILELRRGVPRVIPVTLTAGAEVSQYLEFAETPVTSEMFPPAEPEPPAPAPGPAAPLAGWITATLPFPVEIRENGTLLGTTQTERLMLGAGAHELEFVNPPLNYRVTQSVRVTPGRVTAVSLALPNGAINLNATPWAEVWIDGTRIGETPIGNFAVPIGPHEIVFRHPQLGEKRHAVSVTAGTPVRISVEMKQ